MNQTVERSARSRRSWKVAGVAATVLVVGGGLLAVPALWPLVQELDTSNERSAQTYDRMPELVTVEGETAEIEIGATAGDEVAVDRQLEWAGTKPEITESWHGDDLVVGLGCPEGMFGWVSDVCRVDYRAEVPRSAALDLTATTGDIGFDGVAGDIAATTTTGSLYGTDLESDRVSAQTTTGSIELAFATAPRQVSAQVTTGDVVITVADDGNAYRVAGETETGDREVRISTDPSSERVIDVSSTTGDVTVRYES